MRLQSGLGFRYCSRSTQPGIHVKTENSLPITGVHFAGFAMLDLKTFFHGDHADGRRDAVYLRCQIGTAAENQIVSVSRVRAVHGQ